MPKRTKDDEREQRIHMQIIVDAHDEEELTMGWYNYLEDVLEFPFLARCIATRATSPLRTGEEVEVVDLASGEACEHEMLVEVRWDRRTVAVPLIQLESVANDTETQLAIEDWHYWVEQGYEL